jgi:hypothetical protein
MKSLEPLKNLSGSQRPQSIGQVAGSQRPQLMKSLEESSTKVFAEICIPLIEDDVYSISDVFSKIHVEDIWYASQESHADTFACTMHAYQKSKREPHTSDAILIFSEKHLQKQIGYLNSSRENTQFKKKSSETESEK